MLKLQVVFIAILIICVALVSCERVQKVIEPVADDMMATDDMMPADDMMMNMMKVMDSKMYMSWASKALPAPTMTVEEAAAAMDFAGTGAAHNPGSDIFTPRTFYINDIGAVANKAGTAYPAGTMIFKEIMDETNTFVDKLAMMMKSDDPMYANHNGWVYRKYARPSADAEYMQVRGSNLADAGNGCHGCHAKADNDSVFVSLSMDTMMDIDPIADDMVAGDDTTMDTTTDMTTDAPMDMTTDAPMDMMMKMMMDMETHKSWDSVTLPVPVGTGAAHGTGARTVYFNEAGAMANRAGTAYPAGTMIVKEIMDDTNTFVERVAKMVKTDSADPMSAMYKDHGYWMYVQVKLDAMSNVIEGETKGDVPGGSSAGCHGCHSTAANDKVFVPLSMADAAGTDGAATGMNDAGDGAAQ